MRCEEAGWILASIPDGRRGIWYRHSEDKKAIEICSGREGDDGYVKLTAGETLTEKQISEVEDNLSNLAYAEEIAIDNALHKDQLDNATASALLRSLGCSLHNELDRIAKIIAGE